MRRETVRYAMHPCKCNHAHLITSAHTQAHYVITLTLKLRVLAWRSDRV